MPNKFLLKSVNGEWEINSSLPNGKKLTHKFAQVKDDKGVLLYDGAFVCWIPDVITFIDDFKKEQVFHNHYAQFLLDAYNKKDQYGEYIPEHFHLELLETKKDELIDAPLIKVAQISNRGVKAETLKETKSDVPVDAPEIKKSNKGT